MTLGIKKETLRCLNQREKALIQAGEESGCACCKSVKDCCTGCNLCENSANEGCTPTKAHCP